MHLRVLLLEVDEQLSSAIAEAFRGHGCLVKQATRFDEAIRLLLETDWDLILLGELDDRLGLTMHNGFEAIRRLAQDRPIALITRGATRPTGSAVLTVVDRRLVHPSHFATQTLASFRRAIPPPRPSSARELHDSEVRMIQAAARKARSVRELGRMTGFPRSTLASKMKKYGIRLTGS